MQNEEENQGDFTGSDNNNGSVSHIRSVGIIDLPEWDKSWIIPQICMFIVGMTWMCLMGKANGWFYEDEEHGEKRNRRKSSENH